MTVPTLETVTPLSVHYADGQPTCSGQPLSAEESIAVDRWMYGPDVPPDPQFDPEKPAREVVLRWAARHGLVLFKGARGTKHPLKHHPGDSGCPEPNREGRCRCWVMWDGEGPALIRVPPHMVVLDEDGLAAAEVTASMMLPDHFVIRSRTSGGTKRFGFIPGGVRRAIRPRPDLDVIGNPDGRCVWVKIWDDAGYDVIGRSQAVPEWPASVSALTAEASSSIISAGNDAAKTPEPGAAGAGDLPPTGTLIVAGAPNGRQEDWIYRIANREARCQWELRREFDEDQIVATLAQIARHSEQRDSDPWRLDQLRDKARSAIRFIASQVEAEPAEPGGGSAMAGSPGGDDEVRRPPDVDCGAGKGPEVIRAVTKALLDDAIPLTFVTGGQVVFIELVSGSPDADGSLPLPVTVTAATAPLLASRLAWSTRTFRHVADGKVLKEAEFTPEARLLTAALAPRTWPGMKPLNGITGAPVLRPDGSLLQEPGYDRATGLYLAARVDIPRIPVRPSARDVTWAREMLLGRVLGDFPWCGPADRANYVAMLATQVLRRRLHGSPVPFFPITATSQGSGKTLLSTIAGSLFGKAAMVWTGDDEELRKTLTTIMRSQEGVIVFDNLPEGTVIRSGTLAKLLTDRTWGDRLLGGNVLGKFANDRLWCATGNNLRIGGDMATRSVLISLDPAMPHPERRSDFVIPDLESWIEEPASQRGLLWVLLVLAADWSAAGCPEASVVPMRQFSRWARMAGGFLAHHGIEGFLANAGELEDADDDSADWTQFLARWQAVLGAGWVTSEQAAATAAVPGWGGAFPSGKGGEPLSPKSLGRRLTGIKGRYHGAYVMRGQRDLHTKLWRWQVQTWQG